MGMLNLAGIENFTTDIFDIRYLIIINEDAILMTEDPERVLDITILHEMMHIKANAEGLNKHDIEDFTDLVIMEGPLWAAGIFSTGNNKDGSTAPKLSATMSEWSTEES
jgi:hypothetical protein